MSCFRVSVVLFVLMAACSSAESPPQDAGPEADAAMDTGAGETDAARDAEPQRDAMPDAENEVDAGLDGALPDAADLDAADLDAAQLMDAAALLDAAELMDAAALIDAAELDAADLDAAPAPPQGCSASDRAIASAQLAVARLSPDGTTNIALTHALVTTALVEHGDDDPAGFYVQAEQQGPALLVRVDPATLSPAPKPGDCVALTITEMSTEFAQRVAAAVTGYARLGEGHDLTPLIQDVTNLPNMNAVVADYEAELVSASFTLAEAFRSGGPGHSLVRIDLAGEPGRVGSLRVPENLPSELDLVPTCVLAVRGTPARRFMTRFDLQAWSAEDFDIESCPAPHVLHAVAVNATTVRVSFDRRLDPASLRSDGAQFIFTGGIQATHAVLDGAGRDVLVTTTSQSSTTTYNLVIAATVTDQLGTVLDGVNTSFLGYRAPAVVRLNEVNANIAQTCDLVELRVVQGGSMDGFVLTVSTNLSLTFRLLAVATHDRVVVHYGNADDCSSGSGNETQAMDEQWVGAYPENYDTAFDWYALSGGLSNTNNVLVLRNAAGVIVDAALMSSALTGSVAEEAELRAVDVAAALQWTTQTGTIPDTGYVDDAFRAHAVQSLSGTGTSASGTSLQRVDDADRNRASDWAVAPSTWGSLNVGQSNL